ncbi:MAG: MFS transporter [Alphaproteobacteria bacterium]|nr:MFS transporter [Alphaproteobacteria bacterium]
MTTPVPDHTRRNVGLLAICHGLTGIGNTTMVVESALVGHMLAADKAMATLPLGAMHLAVMLTTFPASFLMQRLGRRAGFSIGAAAGFIGTAICTWAIIQHSFWLFCLGAFVNGIYNGFATFYRFAAADGARPEWKSRAISLVLAGGVFAAILGPEMAKRTTDMLPPHMFAGSFVALTLTSVVAFVLIQFLRIPPASRSTVGGEARPLKEIAAQPTFLVAVASATIAYGVMNFVMTVTPLAMLGCGFAHEQSATVIQWHALAMFLPSFFTGDLIRRFGILRVMAAGVALLLACLAINLTGVTFWHFVAALILLGLGWNFLFVGATTLVTETYRPSERAKVQALNDLVIFGTVAMTAMSSGAVHHWSGWTWINVACAPAVVVAGIAVMWLQRRPRPALSA